MFEKNVLTNRMKASWAAKRAAGEYDNRRYHGFDKIRSYPDKIPCENGIVEAVRGDVNQTYKCNNIVSKSLEVHQRAC
jgi:DNA invertase Pin-like site-specific DNA recombinase